MEKTIAIKKEELSQNIAQAISNAKLPPCIVADTLQLILIQIQQLANEQLAKELEKYRKENKDE